MIEEFVQMLARLNAFKREGDWGHAEEEVDAEFEKLMGTDPGALARLSDTELLAKVAAGEPTQVVRHKTMMVATLLREAGDIAMTGDRSEEGKRFYLQALNLLLDVEVRGDVEEMPEFVPKIDVLASVLSGDEFPLGTQAMLMQHYERIGEFGKAEDALFAMLDEQPDNSAIAEFGMGFYRRLLTKNDVALADGNLPREEIETAIKDLQGRFPATR
jgi:hypothetical protein